MIDSICLGFIVLFIVFGFFRGMISQLMAIVGFVAAYFLAKPASEVLNEPVAKHLGSSEVYGKPFAIFLAGLGIYLICRILGYLFEKLFVRDDSLQTINRIIGALLGGAKGFCILLLGFYVLKFVPIDILKQRAPKLVESQTYQFFEEYPFLDSKYLEILQEPAKLPKAEEEVKQSVTTDKTAAKVIQKTESKMSNEDLSKELSKHIDPKKTEPKKTETPAPKKK